MRVATAVPQHSGLTEAVFDEGADLQEGISGRARIDTRFGVTGTTTVLEPRSGAELPDPDEGMANSNPY